MNGWIEPRQQIEARRARIISSLPPRNAWEPTLEECLAMEADERRRKIDILRARWEKIDTTKHIEQLNELAAEITA